jgi:hypothetical protein
VVDFIVYDMTHLRYFAPFTESLSRMGFQTRWLINMSGRKYNSIGTSADRVKLVQEIARRSGCNSCEVFGTDSSGVCAVTIETGSPGDRIPERYSSVISMQHGFDYTSPERVSGENVLNIMWDQIYARHHATIKSGCKYLVPRVPISFWHDQTERQSEKLATVFYPEVGFHAEARRACLTLLSLGITPIIKQRKKNQDVPDTAGCKIVYDEIWHPSESIFYPTSSVLCVGFGTSAYTDAVPAGLTFVDCTAPSYSRTYLKPSSHHYVSCIPGEEEAAIRAAVQNPSRFNSTTHEERDVFTLSVMETVNVQRS